MTRKIPPDAFDIYVGLGPGRSYQLVARQFGVSKRAISKYATRHQWQSRLASIEAQVRSRADVALVDTVEEMNQRHLKTLKIVQGKALEALRGMPIDSAMSAIRALHGSIRQERIIQGEPADRAAVTIEDVIKREYDRWLEAVPLGDGDDVLDEDGQGEDGDE